MAYKIIITYGGGMGGVNKTYYTYVNEETSSVLDNIESKFIKFTDIENTSILLNTEYVVTVSKCNLVTTVIDATEHFNYHKEKNKKGSGEYESYILYDTYELSLNDTYYLTDEFKRNDNITVKKWEEVVKKI